ncbi:MAG: helix-turn-helix domain-containing protein [Solirubrobacteraceae bacterium]|jgi:AcrR family transcriptional regulator
MTTSDVAPVPELSARRPTRADARRNYELLVAAAREAFAEGGAGTSLEEVARRAHVGIGTLYRHFPTRQALLEAVYLDELDAICRSAADHADLPPWDALIGWLHELVGYLTAKRALADELLAYLDRDAAVFVSCRGALYAAGEPLLQRAQEAGVVRPDTSFNDVVLTVSAIAKLPTDDPGQIERILGVALDGLRYGSGGRGVSAV